MASIRPILLVTGEIYHVFNRGVERRDIFTNKKEYQRITEVVGYYKYVNPQVKFSQLVKLNTERKNEISERLYSKNQKEVIIIAYCFMPNHFHFLLRQETQDGISTFISNICNSYTKYFNTRHERIGPLFQGPFKAVRIESNEQLIHLSRYIHLNPVSSFIIKEENLDEYPWSSLPEYLGKVSKTVSEDSIVMSNFQNREKYRQFVHDQVNYAQELEKIKHLSIDE